MKHAGYIVHVWKVCIANPGVEITRKDVERLIAAKLADWTDHDRLTTDRLRRRLRGMMDRRITAGQPLRYVAV